MFDVIGISKFLRVVLLVNAGLAVLLATEALGLLPAIPAISVVSVSVIATTALIFVLGSTKLFPWLCGLPLMWRIFPNIDGTYSMEVASNWSVIQARREGRDVEITEEDQVALLKRTGTLTITARLLSIEVEVEMDDEYLSSDSVIASLRRDGSIRRPVLFCIFRSHVPEPKSSDSSMHYGAARIPIPFERRPQALVGNHWTDRNWHRGLNTAGAIRLTRISTTEN